jgi:3'(2'), 5'-bisphosphate nucleotidase
MQAMPGLIGQTTIDALVPVVCDACRVVMQIYEQPKLWNLTHKSDASPLTEADLRANDIILAALARITPQVPVLSEESQWLGRDASCYWAVDPLDGTREFIQRNGEFTVNIGLVVDGVARLGVIAAPVLGTIWAGIRGDEPGLSLEYERRPAEGFEGSAGIRSWVARAQITGPDASCGGQAAWDVLPSLPRQESFPPLTEAMVSQAARLGKGLRVVGSRSQPTGATPEWIKPLMAQATVTACGSSLKFCLIAQDDADLYLRRGPTSIWDTVAGHAILAAAGGYVVDMQTRKELDYSDPEKVRNPDFVAYLPRPLQ